MAWRLAVCGITTVAEPFGQNVAQADENTAGRGRADHRKWEIMVTESSGILLISRLVRENWMVEDNI